MAFSSCADKTIDFKESEKRGKSIADAVKTYLKKEGKLPNFLDDLVPEYLVSIPEVKTNSLGTKRYFKYNVYNIIPHSGCFMLKFMHKSDGDTYQYDSRTDLIENTGVSTMNNDYIEENITFEDVSFLKSKIQLYYNDSLKYPKSLKDLIPVYMNSFPYDTSAKYRPYNIAPKFKSELLEYEYYQPSDSFRGDYELYFDVTFGQYRYITESGSWYYDD